MGGGPIAISMISAGASGVCWSRKHGLIPGNRVLLRGPNGYAIFAAWLGVLKAGGVVVATMPFLRPGEIATVIERAEISHAIVDSRFIGDFRQAAEQTHSIKHIVKYDGDYGHGELESRTASLQPLPACGHWPRRPGTDRLHQRHDRRAQGLRPLPPRHHRAVRYLRAASGGSEARRRLPDQRADGFHLRARHHAMFPLRFGGSSATIEQASPQLLLDAIVKHGVTHLGTAPTAYKAMLSGNPRKDWTSRAENPPLLHLGRRAPAGGDLARVA